MAIQQGRRRFGARSVHGVREDDKDPRTPLVDFFNRANEGGTHDEYRNAIGPYRWITAA